VVNHEEIVSKVIEDLKKNLKVEHIPGLKSEIDSYRNQLAGKAYGRDTWARGGGDTVLAGSGVTISTNSDGNKVIAASSSTSFADNETPTGLINSSNVTYTLANTPSPAASLLLYLNGQLLTAGGVDYTLATATITMVNAPGTGGALKAWYRY